MQDSALKLWALRLLLVAVVLFMMAPIGIVIVNSFNASAFNAWPPTGFTLDWYAKVLSDPNFRAGAVNSLIVGVASTVLVLLLGMPIAYALARFRMRGAGLLRATLFAPLVVPRVAIGFALFVLFVVVGGGLYGSYLGITLAHAILMLPFVVTILASTIGEIDPLLEEAARDLGATPLQAFRRAVLPQLGGALVVSGIFAFITSFDEVETTIFIVKPAVNTLPVEMYHYMEQYQDPTLAALSTLLILFTLLIALVVPFAVRGNVLLKMMGSGRQV
ncbi:ABC transporter permease [Alloyangia pacifica]|uniref:Putative spermidine/putrescine transport system permease protein n=1 Tax=Alloyangia pacifica TaxID=311180 RepID=A0A1I6UXB7_9RHOB|nr:ABC transporter permease [Alloyangia pacifica]SDI29507.1 putative spermidine/putrescine transport system permease protein [Alloyangia pacifica]SFT06072.1 putative spermidine/putrescine transport system permease protein [Alloyangia pacifica]